MVYENHVTKKEEDVRLKILEIQGFEVYSAYYIKVFTKLFNDRLFCLEERRMGAVDQKIKMENELLQECCNRHFDIARQSSFARNDILIFDVWLKDRLQ